MAFFQKNWIHPGGTLAWCAAGDYPEGEVIFLLEEGDSSDFDPALDKFAPNSSDSSSSDSDEEANLGGCSGPPDFSFYMFSSNLPKVSQDPTSKCLSSENTNIGEMGKTSL